MLECDDDDDHEDGDIATKPALHPNELTRNILQASLTRTLSNSNYCLKTIIYKAMSL